MLEDIGAKCHILKEGSSQIRISACSRSSGLAGAVRWKRNMGMVWHYLKWKGANTIETGHIGSFILLVIFCLVMHSPVIYPALDKRYLSNMHVS